MISLNHQGSYLSTKYRYRMHIALGMDWDIIYQHHHITHDMTCPNIRVVGNRFLSSCPQLARCRCGQCELTASGSLSGARCGGEEGRRSRGFPPCFRVTWLRWTVETEQCCRHVSPRRRGHDGGGRRQPRARPRRGGGGRHGEAAPRRAADRGQDRRVLV